MKKYTVLKTENPTTGKQSTINTAFSSEHWNTPTLTLLTNIKALGGIRFEKIFNAVSMKIGTRRGHGIVSADDINNEDLLQSESDSSDDAGDVLMSDNGEQNGDE